MLQRVKLVCWCTNSSVSCSDLDDSVGVMAPKLSKATLMLQRGGAVCSGLDVARDKAAVAAAAGLVMTIKKGRNGLLLSGRLWVQSKRTVMKGRVHERK